MDFNQKLDNYAELICKYGLNIQKDQILRLQTEPINISLAEKISRQAYLAGAKHVDVKLYSPLFTRIRIESAEADSLDYVPNYMQAMYDEYLDDQIASCSILGSENPDELEGLDPDKLTKIRLANHKAFKKFREEGINNGKVQWTLASASTPGWAKKVFPDLEVEQAVARLWEEIFKICRVDQENFLELWEEHDQKLKARSKHLDDLKIKELHFTGPGTDLIVGLTEKALFVGGRSQSDRGEWFEPNIPTEECFTTPDYRKTSGIVKVTRDFRANGTLIKNLVIEFAAGEIVSATADSGIEAFESYYKSDEGAKRLGEVALVGIDSPVYQSGLLFDEVLFDENAACHIAIGSAYKKCIDGGVEMSEKDLELHGINESSVHQDMMISSEEVSVQAKTYDDQEVILIKSGEWMI